MYLTILLLPFLGSFISGFMGRKLGVSGAHLITSTSIILSSILATVAFYEVGLCGSPVSINLNNWIDSGFMSISWEFLFDSLTVSMFIPVLYISSLIHIFSIDYMSSDPHNQRFFSYLSLFTFFMLILVSGSNYFVMFIGWEGIGIVSYLLINFWFTRIQANKAAILALTMNRVGDMGLSIGFFAIFALTGSLDYSTVFSVAPLMNENAITIIGILLLSGALAKSAQIPLHSWLPGSMEGPTPVSALIHAATLVTAGLYLLLRSSPILEYSETSLLLITLIGASTAFFGACSALVQNDLKRIIAFSTISQLGYMVLAVGLSQYSVALMHVVNHAFFKALLFLGGGAIIHSVSDQQDIRKLGGLIHYLPLTYTVMLIGSIALLGLPWLSGFYSKDLIIELAYSRYTFSGNYAFILASISAGLTAFYSCRLISLVFLTYPNASRNTYQDIHEVNYVVYIPLIILALFSIFFGFVFSDLFVGMATDFFGNSLFHHLNHISLVEAEFSLPIAYKLLPTILSVIGVCTAFILYHQSNHISNISQYIMNTKILLNIYTFLIEKGYFDIIYNNYIIKTGLKYGLIISKSLDRGSVEVLGAYGLAQVLTYNSVNASKYDDGKITTYGVYMILGSILVVLFAPILTESVGLFSIWTQNPIFNDSDIVYSFFYSIKTQNNNLNPTNKLGYSEEGAVTVQTLDQDSSNLKSFYKKIKNKYNSYLLNLTLISGNIFSIFKCKAKQEEEDNASLGTIDQWLENIALAQNRPKAPKTPVESSQIPPIQQETENIAGTLAQGGDVENRVEIINNNNMAIPSAKTEIEYSYFNQSDDNIEGFSLLFEPEYLFVKFFSSLMLSLSFYSPYIKIFISFFSDLF